MNASMNSSKDFFVSILSCNDQLTAIKPRLSADRCYHWSNVNHSLRPNNTHFDPAHASLSIMVSFFFSYYFLPSSHFDKTLLSDEVVSLFHDSLLRYNRSAPQLSFYRLILWDEVLSIFEDEWCGWRSLFQPMPTFGVTTRYEMIYSNYSCIFIFVDLITVWRKCSSGFLALFKFSMMNYL